MAVTPAMWSNKREGSQGLALFVRNKLMCVYVYINSDSCDLLIIIISTKENIYQVCPITFTGLDASSLLFPSTTGCHVQISEVIKYVRDPIVKLTHDVFLHIFRRETNTVRAFINSKHIKSIR